MNMNLSMIKDRILTALENNKLIHFSHTDLDGYGCHLVTRYICNQTGDSMPVTYNSEELGEKFQEFLENIIRMMYSNDDRRLLFLVTDIGEIDMVGFADRFSKYNINLIIMDHHKITEPKKVGEDVYVDPDTGYSVYYHSLGNVSAQYIHTTKQSATLIYATVCGLDNYSEFKFISEYDCGRWGEWRLDKTHIPSVMTKLNQGLQIIKSIYSDEKTSHLVTYLNEYIKYLKYDDSYDCSDYDHHFGKLLDNMVNAKCNENTRLYNKWLRSIEVSDLHHYQYIFNVVCENPSGQEFNKKVVVKLPADPKYLGPWAIIIQRDKDEGPFSVYSKQYLEDHPNIKGIIKYTPNFKDIVSLRSASDEIDVSAIARLNGGGGHVRASGFMAKPEILM